MDKNNIKLRLQSFLGEADRKPVGKTETDKVQNQEKTVNNDYYKEVSKKMGEYDSASKSDKDSVKKGDLEKTSSEDTKDVNFNGMDQIQYDNEPSDKFKERAKEALVGSSKMGNKTYTGAENGNTEEVWGASGGKHTGEEIVKAAEAQSKLSAYPQEDAVGYNARPKEKELAYESKEKTNEIIKENKMEKPKRLRFKNPFNGLGKALTLIPESYKVDNKVFEMTDGNENYKIRWEGDVNEGQAVVLTASDKKLMNEDIQHMKHLMGFKAETTLGTPTAKERVSENTTFRDMMNLTSQLLEGEEAGDKKPLIESAFAGHGFTSESNLEEVSTVSEEEVTEDVNEGEVDEANMAPEIKAAAAKARKEKEAAASTNESEEISEEEVSESKGETPNEGGESSKIGATADGIVRGAGHDKHIMEEDDAVLEGFENPTVFTISEGEATENMAAGDDLGTDIGKTAAGDPRGAGHDKHIMEEEESEVEVELGGVEVEVSKEEDEEEEK